MAAELPRPGVEVIQQFRATSPTVTTPTLPPVVVGACKQVVDVVTQSPAGGSQINPGATVVLPAFFIAKPATGTPPVYALPHGVFRFAVGNRPAVTVPFAAGNYKPSDVAALVQRALRAAEETDGVADVVGGTSWRLRTLSTGDSSVIDIDPEGQAAAVVQGSADLSALTPGDLDGLELELQFDGTGTSVVVEFDNPANLAEVLEQINDVLGSKGTASLTPDNELLLASSTVGANSAVYVAGGNALALLGLTEGQVGAGRGSTPGILSAFGLASTDRFFGESAYCGWELRIPTTNFPDPRGNLEELVFEADTVRAFVGTGGGSSVFEALRTTSLLRKNSGSAGFVKALDDGNGDNQTPFLQVVGEDFTATTIPASAGTVVASSAPMLGQLAGKTLVLGDGRHPREVQFGAVLSLEDVVQTINDAFNPNDGIVASDDGGVLRLTCTKKREDGTTPARGEESQVILYGGTALVPTNLLDPGPAPTLTVGRFAGDPLPAAVGDDVYVDGTFLGKVVQVAPNGTKSVLKLSRQLPLTFTGKSYHIVANGLAPLPAGPASRPAPDLLVDGEGNITLKSGLLRDPLGRVVESRTSAGLLPGRGALYVSYRALRLDVTQRAKTPGLLRFNDTIQLTQLLEPVSPDNPLALGLFFALLNAPAIQCMGLGVDAVSADSPYGTVEAFARAATYLESFEVYGIAPMTHDEAVGQVFQTHVSVMSEAANKGERIVLFNPKMPTHRLDKLVASGLDGGTVGASGIEFDTGVADLSALLMAAGIDPTQLSIPVESGLFLDIASNNLHYSIERVSGSVVTIRTEFTGAENDDGFYATTGLNEPPLPAALISEPFAIRIRGEALTLPDGTPDKDGIADTYAALGRSFSNHRYWQTAPDKCRAVIGGLEQVIEGFYMNAAIVGMIGQQPPQQSFTGFPMAGFSGVVGSNDFFTDRQMNRMAAGGTYIIVQDTPGGPLTSRQALTTNMTSIETRTDSIIKVVDFTAKFLRRALKNFIGRFNITQGFLDSLGHVLEGLLDFLKGAGVLIGAHVNNIVQDEAAPDTVLIDVTLDVPYPCNYIRLTLVI